MVFLLRTLYHAFLINCENFAFYLFRKRKIQKSNLFINLCCGNQKITSYFNIDYNPGCDLRLDLSKYNLPFDNDVCQGIVCTSAINYFTYSRAREIIKDCYRVLKPDGVLRIGVQDLELIAKHYVDKNKDFFFQKTSNNIDRFPGATIGDKFVAWFYGHPAGNSYCKYFYDFGSLSHVVKEAGFRTIERKKFQESRLSNIENLDNRPDQMFFLEAVK